MKYFLRVLIYFIAVCHALTVLAVNPTADYDSLARQSSEQLMQRGRLYYEQRQAGKALACFVIVGERYKKSDDIQHRRLSIRALNNAACVYKFIYSDYSRAYELFTQAYDLCEECHYDEFMPVVMVNLGDLLNDYSRSYHSQSLSQQAHDLFNQCMQRAVETKNWELMTTAFFNLSNQNYSLPLEPYRCIFNSEIPDSTPDLTYVRLQYQGLQHLQQHQYREARQCFSRQLDVVSARWEPERDTLASYMSIAHTYRMERDYPHETEYLEKAYLMASEGNASDQSANICQLLAESYGMQGQTDMQRHYRTLYLENKEDILTKRLANVGELNYIYQLRKEEQRATQLSERHHLQQMVILGIAVLLLVVVVSMLLLWRKTRQLVQRNKKLFDKNRQLLRIEQEALRVHRECEELRKECHAMRETSHRSATDIEPDAVSPCDSSATVKPSASAVEGKYSHSNLSTEQKEVLIFRIQEIMSRPENICQQDFTLGKLAKLADSNTSYVSQVINEHYGNAFSNVLSCYRIREACRRINDETMQYSQITIEAIATSVGFKSRTSFINAFKRETGLTPSEYMKIAMGKPTAS